MKKDKKNSDENIEEIEELDQEKNEAPQTPEIEEDSDELEELRAENKKLKEDFLRAYADAENVKKRCQSEIEKNNRYAISSFAKDLLAVVDNLERAISSVPENERKNNTLLQGVELTNNELIKVLGKFGVKKMNILGTVFDPNFHQVIQEVEDKDKEPGTIIAEIQPGYLITDRILREAMVVVAKK